MFDDEEYRQLSEVYRQCVEAIKEYRRTYRKTLGETPRAELYQPLFARYKELAGVDSEFEAEEIMQRHYLSRWQSYKHEAK